MALPVRNPLLRSSARVCAVVLLVFAATSPLPANITITPTYDSSITGDSNAAAIEADIQTAINLFQANLADPITVTITFKKDTAISLGSTSSFFGNLPYSTYLNALSHDTPLSANDSTALALIGGTNNPVNGNVNINVKTANLRAVGINVVPANGATDGTISLNTNITHAGSVGTTGAFNLTSVVEHEIDEVLGLGSSLPTIRNGTIFPEDLFRYQINNAGSSRSFTTTNTGDIYFSIDGLTKLAQFDNQNDGGDFGDWQSNPLPNGVLPQVQDAFATSGSNPTLGINELTALDVIGYNLVAVPESSRAIKIALGMMGVVLVCSKIARRDKITRVSSFG